MPVRTQAAPRMQPKPRPDRGRDELAARPGAWLAEPLGERRTMAHGRRPSLLIAVGRLRAGAPLANSAALAAKPVLDWAEVGCSAH